MSLEHRGAFGALDLGGAPGNDAAGLRYRWAGRDTGKSRRRKTPRSPCPAAGQKTRVSCSFTGRTAALDPVEGTLELALPKTPLFIRALTWRIDLPRGYQAETHGNLIRSADPSAILRPA